MDAPFPEVAELLELVNDEPNYALMYAHTSEETTLRSIRFLSEVITRAKRLGRPRWGLLEKPGRGLIPDILTYAHTDGEIVHIDVLSGGDGFIGDASGTSAPRLIGCIQHGKIRSEWRQVIPEEPVDPDPDPDPDPDKPGTEERLDRLETGYRVVSANLDNVDRRQNDFNTRLELLEHTGTPAPVSGILERLESKLDRLLVFFHVSG